MWTKNKPPTFYISLFSDTLSEEELLSDIVDKIIKYTSKLGYTRNLLVKNRDTFISEMTELFKNNVAKLFSEYKITLQIRLAVKSDVEILFDFVTDLFSYFQIDSTKSNKKTDHIALSFGIHYSHIIHSTQSKETHISDLFGNLPQSKLENKLTTSFKVHYRKNGVFNKSVYNGFATNKIYFYLSNDSDLLKSLTSTLLIIHKTMDDDTTLESIVNDNLYNNRIILNDSNTLMINNIVFVDPLEVYSKIQDPEKKFYDSFGSNVKLKRLICG